jgi:hypothetical protein
MATKIHRPSPNGATGRGRITSCKGVHRGGGRGGEGACFGDTLAARGLEEFFSSCAVVSVFGSGGKQVLVFILVYLEYYRLVWATLKTDASSAILDL